MQSWNQCMECYSDEFYYRPTPSFLKRFIYLRARELKEPVDEVTRLSSLMNCGKQKRCQKLRHKKKYS